MLPCNIEEIINIFFINSYIVNININLDVWKVMEKIIIIFVLKNSRNNTDYFSTSFQFMMIKCTVGLCACGSRIIT